MASGSPMRIALQPPSPEKLQSLEASAKNRPGLYRFRLALLAITGDVILTFLRVFPFAGPIVLGALYVNNLAIYAAAAFAVLLLIWVVRPSQRDRGTGLKRNDAPNLFAALDELRAKLNVGRRLDVRLEDDMNASAREVRGLFGLIGNRRVLTLGIPLLALLGRDEVRAVIAHEFGHFSRRHGRLGHWLYQAHLGWLSYSDQVDSESSVLDRAGAAFADMFAPAFSRRAMVWSRRCEYEADADAADAVSREHIVNALARAEAFDAWRNDVLPRILYGWQRTEPNAPADILQREIAAFETALPEILGKTADKPASHASDWSDTHPRLDERALALGIQPNLVPHQGPNGSALLGASWPTIAAEYNARWREANAVDWSVAHTRYRLMEAPLIEAEPDTVAGWPIAQRLDRARTLRKYEPAHGLSELEALHAAAPDNRYITFAYASAGLTEGDASAVDTMRALAKEDATWRVSAYVRLLHYHNRIGDRAGVRRWTALLESASAAEMDAYASVHDGVRTGQPSPTTRPAPFIETLRAGLRVEPAVVKAWLVETTAPLAMPQRKGFTTIKADVLILVLDALDAKQEVYDAGAVRARQQQALGDLVEPNALPAVLSFYAAEALPPALRKVLDAHPACGIYVR